MADEWPLRSFLELGALPGAVPCARLHARQVVWEWGLGGASADIELLVSELVTNAIRASESLRQAAAVRMWLLSDRARVLVLVWDACARPPVRIEVGQEADGGRGLMLVDAINEHPGAISPESLPRPGEVALLTAINLALDVPAGELPDRVALVRRYIDAALEAVHGNRRATFLVVAQMLARDASRTAPADGDGPSPR